MERLQEIEEKVLKLFYNNFADWNCHIEVEELFNLLNLEEMDKNKYLQVLVKLIDEKILYLMSSSSYREPKFKESGMKDAVGIGMEGILFYENKIKPFQKDITEMIVGLLYLCNEIDEGKYKLTDEEISVSELKEFYEKEFGIKLNFTKLYFMLRDFGSKFCSHSYPGFLRDPDRLKFLNLDGPILTVSGKKFLDYEMKLRNLFQNVSNAYGKKVLDEEYGDIQFLREKKIWKDIAIKIGSILDYLTYDYFEKNNISIPNNTFHERLLYIQQNNLIGNSNDWFQADNILRHYRNFVHLQELVKKTYIFNEDTINIIYPIFERLVSLF